MGWRTRRGPTKFDETEKQRVREQRLAGMPVPDIARAHGTSPGTIAILTKGLFPRRRGPVPGRQGVDA